MTTTESGNRMTDSVEQRLADLEQQVRVLRDRQEIYDTLMRYCRGIDRGDAELVASTYPAYPSERIIEMLMRETEVCMHLVGNCLIEVQGDEAVSESSFISYQVISRDGARYVRTRAGRYLHQWRRTDHGWVTEDRDVRDEWNSLDEITAAPLSEKWVYGERSHSDIVYSISETLKATHAARDAAFAAKTGIQGAETSAGGVMGAPAP
jgi:hypothetical protein